MTTAHLNPETLPRNPAFSQAVVVRDPAATIYVGGQNAVTADGEIVGDDIATQTTQALANLEVALAAAGATMQDVVHWTIAVVDGQSMHEGFEAFMRRWGAGTGDGDGDGDAPAPPAISVHIVAGLAHPQFLVEISAVAAL
jgi:enamine deaminase RidA (YjgF/YER057c/UK114 family)